MVKRCDRSFFFVAVDGDQDDDEDFPIHSTHLALRLIVDIYSSCAESLVNLLTPSSLTDDHDAA